MGVACTILLMYLLKRENEARERGEVRRSHLTRVTLQTEPSFFLAARRADRPERLGERQRAVPERRRCHDLYERRAGPSGARRQTLVVPVRPTAIDQLVQCADHLTILACPGISSKFSTMPASGCH